MTRSVFVFAAISMIALFVFLLVTLGQLWTKVDQSHSYASENVTWSAASSSIEMLRLSDSLRSFATNPKSSALHGVQVKYEIVLSRFATLTEGVQADHLRANGHYQIMMDVRDEVFGLESDIYALNLEHPPAVAFALADRVLEMERDIFPALVGVSNRSASRLSILRDGFIDILDSAIVSLTLLTLFGIGIAVLLMVESQRRQAADKARDLALAEEARANQAKTEFLSAMSHELRTPMNAILGFAQLLDNNKKTPLSRSQQKAVNQILRSGEHLLQLINQVLDLSKIEAGQEVLSFERVRVSGIVGDCVRLVAPLGQKRGITIDFGETISNAEVNADPLRLRQVVMNLLSNAVKYNKDHGHVRVDVVKRDDSNVAISVADTGIGIAAEDTEEIFRPFSRIYTDDLNVEGTGIGLTISKSFVERMGGAIVVDSTESEGSIFTVTLPAIIPEDATADVVPVADLVSFQGAGEQPFKVLYVEDNPTNIVLMEDVIDVVPNAQLISAHNAELGIAIAEAERPDVVLMDINLPGMNGLEALAEFKRHPNLSSTPVIAITGDVNTTSANQGRAAGFHEFLVKPFDLEQLMSVLRELRKEPPAPH